MKRSSRMPIPSPEDKNWHPVTLGKGVHAWFDPCRRANNGVDQMTLRASIDSAKSVKIQIDVPLEGGGGHVHTPPTTASNGGDERIEIPRKGGESALDVMLGCITLRLGDFFKKAGAPGVSRRLKPASLERARKRVQEIRAAAA